MHSFISHTWKRIHVRLTWVETIGKNDVFKLGGPRDCLSDETLLKFIYNKQ